MAMCITNPALPDNPIVFCNEAFQRLTGYDREEIIGQNCRFLQGPDTDKAGIDKVRKCIAEGSDVAIDLLNYRKDGTTFWNALYLSTVRGENGEIKFYFASQLDVTSRIEAKAAVEEQRDVVEREVARRTAQLEEALAAKTLLLHEVDHRVKNNLTMIGALLRLQSRQLDNPEMARKLEIMMERIDALATVHRRLYQSNDVTRFDIAGFAETLASDVIASSGRSDITLESAIEPIDISSEFASSLGLILNEILTNAIKHGLDGRRGSIRLSAVKSNGTSVITVEDDGHGIVLGKSDGGLGKTLITRLSKQADAKVAWVRLDQGTRVTLTMASSA
ncbi:PAS domain S-box-containing protein [Bosea sp. BE125]|nr:PAS domain S-box-containing protein [Bosea sp. BE125]